MRTARTNLRAARIGHVDVLAVVGPQHEAHIDDSGLAVGANQEPIGAAGEYGALEARALKFAAGYVHDYTGPVGRIWNQYWRRDLSGDFEERF